MLTLTTRRVPAIASAILVLVFSSLLWTAAAAAHSLDSSTISLRLDDDRPNATISIALETLDQALGSNYTDRQDDLIAYENEVIAYLSSHLTVTGYDGSEWGQEFTGAERESVEGIQSFSADVTFDPGEGDADHFTITYDGIISEDSTHEAVVVLTDSAGEISTAGILTEGDESLTIYDGGTTPPLGDMVSLGFDHVLEGADHLLFLLTLLLPAPLIATAGAWQRGPSARTTAHTVLRVVTAFTIGHSITLIAAALGIVDLPGQPIEVLIAASVGIAAVHAIRPLATGGETKIAFTFGLIHGIAFAGILADLGIDGSTSIPSLLAFNVGVELAQLEAVALIFPSLYLLSRTRAYTSTRISAAVFALIAATAWALDRVELLSNPLAGVEDAAISNLWTLVLVTAAVAGLAWTAASHRLRS